MYVCTYYLLCFDFLLLFPLCSTVVRISSPLFSLLFCFFLFSWIPLIIVVTQLIKATAHELIERDRELKVWRQGIGSRGKRSGGRLRGSIRGGLCFVWQILYVHFFMYKFGKKSLLLMFLQAADLGRSLCRYT